MIRYPFFIISLLWSSLIVAERAYTPITDPQIIAERTITSLNFKNKGYSVELSNPRSKEPEYINILIKFPKNLSEDFKYAYSSALYSKNNKTMLSYRPEDISLESEMKGELIISANKYVISCLSLVNVYHQHVNGKTTSLHPPEIFITFDLFSFFSGTEESACGNKISASNYY